MAQSAERKETAGAEATPRVLLEWRVHRLRKEPVRVVPVLFVIALGVGLIQYAYGAPLLTAVSAVVLLGSIMAYLFPITYRLTEEGIEFHNFLNIDKRRWHRFEGYTEGPDAIYVRHYQVDLRGRILKGMILFLAGNRDQVVAVLDRQLGAR